MSISLLLADDSPTIAKILGMALQSEPYEIRSVLTADDALKELRANPPVFFLVDLTLPAKSGYEFARLIRNDQKLSKTRVVLLASAFEPVDENMFKASGADAVVVKPFDPAELRAKLRELGETPPKFPVGSQVQGALSGQAVSAPPLAPPPAAAPTQAFSAKPTLPPLGETDLLDLAGEGSGENQSADSILSGLMGGADTPPAPPAGRSSPLPTPLVAEKTSASIMLDLSDEPPVFQATDSVLDLSAVNVADESNKTAMIDRSKLDSPLTQESPEDVLGTLLGTKEEKLPPMPAADAPLSAGAQALSDFFAAELGNKPPAAPPTAAAPVAPVAPVAPPAPAAPIAAAPPATPPRAPTALPAAPIAPPVSAADEPLSANAEALAAFFSAEISGGQKAAAPVAPPAPPPAPEPMGDDAAFDASLGSIDWATPPEASLNAWSSNTAPPAAPVAPIAPVAAPAALTRPQKPVSPARAQAKAKPDPGIGASQGGSPMFDTGGSNFRFSEDYVARITRSFTGALDEHVPPHQPHAQAEEPVFHQESSDSAPSAGGGAWSHDQIEKVEQLVREEVQMVVREVVEKVAWEVIPELAENLIKKELEKVLKQLET